MAHERHANFLQDAGLHQASVERVAEIMETDVADARISQCGFPRALDDADRATTEVDHQSPFFPTFKQVLVKPFGKRDLA